MFALEVPVQTADEAARLVRALGTHRYVRSRLHEVHAFAFASAAAESPDPALAEGGAWATALLTSGEVDIASRDPRLVRRATEAELAAVLAAFWSPEDAGARTRARLQEWLQRAELPIEERVPFDEAGEEDIHPLLVDAGWELVPLGELDAERHKGMMGAFGEAIDFEVARFEEESAIPPHVYLHELPAMGPVELLRGADEWGDLTQPFPLWAAGHEVYHDYLVRGVCRAAKLPAID